MYAVLPNGQVRAMHGIPFDGTGISAAGCAQEAFTRMRKGVSGFDVAACEADSEGDVCACMCVYDQGVEGAGPRI